MRALVFHCHSLQSSPLLQPIAPAHCSSPLLQPAPALILPPVRPAPRPALPCPALSTPHTIQTARILVLEHGSETQLEPYLLPLPGCFGSWVLEGRGPCGSVEQTLAHLASALRRRNCIWLRCRSSDQKRVRFLSFFFFNYKPTGQVLLYWEVETGQ